MQETQGMCVWSLDWEDLLEEKMAPHSIILAWKKKKKSHKQRSLAGYSPTGCKELDMNEQLSMCLLWFSRAQLSATQWAAAHEASLSPGVRSDSCPVGRWCHPTISSSVDITSLQGSYSFYSEHQFYSYCPTKMFHWDRQGKNGKITIKSVYTVAISCYLRFWGCVLCAGSTTICIYAHLMFLRTSKSRDGHYRSHSAEYKTEDLWRKETVWGWVYWGKSARGKLSGRSREHPVLTEAKGPKTPEEMKDRKGGRERQGRKGDYETVLILTKPNNNIKRRCSSVNGSILSKASVKTCLLGPSWWSGG